MIKKYSQSSDSFSRRIETEILNIRIFLGINIKIPIFNWLSLTKDKAKTSHHYGNILKRYCYKA